MTDTDPDFDRLNIKLLLIWYAGVMERAARVIGDRADDDAELNALATELWNAEESARVRSSRIRLNAQT